MTGDAHRGRWKAPRSVSAAEWPIRRPEARERDGGPPGGISPAARNALVVANDGLVWAVARRLAGRGLPLDDLVQEGRVGLLRAAERFDPALGLRFSTFATAHVQYALRDALENARGLVRAPKSAHRRLRAWKRKRQAGAGAGGPPPPRDDIARSAARAACAPEALGRFDDEDVPLADPGTGPSELVERAEERARVRELVDGLPGRVRTVVALRCGLWGEGPLSNEEIGRRLGLGAARVSQLYHEGLRRLRERVERPSGNS